MDGYSQRRDEERSRHPRVKTCLVWSWPPTLILSLLLHRRPLEVPPRTTKGGPSVLPHPFRPSLSYGLRRYRPRPRPDPFGTFGVVPKLKVGPRRGDSRRLVVSRPPSFGRPSLSPSHWSLSRTTDPPPLLTSPPYQLPVSYSLAQGSGGNSPCRVPSTVAHRLSPGPSRRRLPGRGGVGVSGRGLCVPLPPVPDPRSDPCWSGTHSGPPRRGSPRGRGAGEGMGLLVGVVPRNSFSSAGPFYCSSLTGVLEK